MDWGSFLTGVLGETVPEGLIGLHLTMPFAGPPAEQVALDERDLAGLAALNEFPEDARRPRAWCEQRFTDLRRWTDHEHGGHFPALKQPEVLVSELRSFFADLR
ncbi:hypothetical protein [Streptomyces sp. 549]|uniref:hypothetical protein n=1 Tax=Streptomyces sp. 549 TaxID=3049076 RepID=UPI0032E35E0F